MILGEVIFAEVGIETLAGGGVTGMLVAIMVVFMRRTKDTDERRDEASRLLMDAARQQEDRAWAERDRLVAEIERLRENHQHELDRLREQQERDRRRWMKGQGWQMDPTTETRLPRRGEPEPGPATT